MNIKKRFALVLIITLFAAPFAAFGQEIKTTYAADFADSFVLESDLGPISLRVENVKRVGTAQVGNIDIGSERYIVRQFNNERTVEHVSRRIDAGSQEDCNLQIAPFDGNIEFPTVRPMTAPLSPRIIRHLILYEPSAATQVGGTDLLLAEIQWGIAQLRRTLDNSGMQWVGVHVVAILPYSHDVPSSGWWPGDQVDIQGLRTANYADTVSFIVDDWPAGGTSNIFMDGDPRNAYNVVNRIRIFQGSYTHEFGHLLGYDHNRETAGPVPPGVPPFNRSMELCFENSIENVAGIMSTSSSCTDGATRTELFPGEGIVYNNENFWGPDAMQVQVAPVTVPVIANYVGDPPNTGPCVPDNITLCLDGVRNSGDRRFEVRVAYESDFAHVNGDGRVAHWSSPIGGLFYFFTSDNPELLVKIINGCASNGHFWVYLTAGTNLGYTVTIRDTVTNLPPLELGNPDAVLAAPFADIEAISCN